MNPVLFSIFIAVNIPPCVATLIVTSYYKRINQKLASIKLYIYFATFMQLLQLVLWFRHTANLFLLHFFVPVEFVLLAHFYQTILQNLINRKIILVVSSLFVIFCIINSAFIQNLSTFNSHVLVSEDVILTIMSIATFTILLNRRAGLNKLPIGPTINWINSGIFINFSTTLVLFYFSNLLLPGKMLSYVVWLLNDAATVTMYCCFIIAIRKNLKLHEQR